MVRRNLIRSLTYHPFFIRLFHWEYWSFGMVYLPMYIIWLWLCLRARSFFFFAAANPTIKNGGFLNESKKEIFPLIPGNIHPRTVFFSHPADALHVLQQIEKESLQFPLVGKPNVGSKGRGVKLLHTLDDLKQYVGQTLVDFHIQEFVQYPQEVGIFYYRYPGQSHGHLSGIVRKEFLTIRGDGHLTIRELIGQNRRAVLQLKGLEKLLGAEMNCILAAGEERVLVPYGNHARGALFLDDSHLIDEKLTQTIDSICRQIPEFYFGRLDIRFRTWEELKEGKNIAIIEVNGAGSEPTHIYDPIHSLFYAWKEIIRHWVILRRISHLNHRLGVRYLTVREGIQMFREDRLWSAKLEQMKD